MNNISLFIENQEVELNTDSIFAITRQFEEVINPTIIINDWSKTIKIPATRKNNEIFGYCYNPDRVIVENSDSATGLSFDPFKKLSFRLEYADDVIMTGYAKNIYVTRSNNELYYNITLNGEIGRIFQELKKITFDPTEPETKYIIDGSKYIKGNISKETVLGSWNSRGQKFSYLIPTANPLYSLYDIIGFAPVNAYSSDFDYTTFQSKVNESYSFINTLSATDFKKNTGIDPETAIPNGMLPREIGEYRSYLQQPFIYFNKLMRIFLTKATSVTGYKYVLDPSWFKSDNPYWYKLCYMLKKLDTDNVVESSEISSQLLNTDSNGLLIDSRADTGVDGTKSYDNILIGDDIVLTGHKGFYIISNILFSLNWLVSYSNVDYFGQYFKVPILTVQLKGSKNTINVAKVAIVGNNNPFKANLPSDLTHTIITERSDSTNTNYRWAYGTGILRNPMNYAGGYYVKIDEQIGVRVSIPSSTLRDDNYTYTPVCKLEWFNTYTGGFNYPYEYSDSYGGASDNAYSWFGEGSKISIIGNAGINVNVPQRSNTPLYMHNLWDSNYNLFDEILNYCKMFRIGIFCDDNNKIVTFKPLSSYFSNYKILDWNDKIDHSQEIVIKPISFENKYVNFNYNDIKTKLGTDYKEEYGLNYGDFLLTTEYNFNNSTEDLFKYAKAAIVNTDNVLSWTNLYDNNRIVYSFPTEIFIDVKDKDKKYVSPFGSYFFHNGLSKFNVGGNTNMRRVMISDDTPLQTRTGLYFYSQSLNGVRANTYPNLSPVNGTNLCLFNVPSKNYTYDSGLYTGKASIYYNFWEKYIKERYNKQNKIVTCWVRLTPEDYANFEFNNFITYENQLYFVNKIYDYSPTNDFTKVDLITIQDVDGYTKSNYLETTLKLVDAKTGKAVPSELHLQTTQNSFEWLLTSSSNWEWEDVDSSLQDFYIDDKNGRGTGKRGVNIPLHITLGNNISSGDNGIIRFTNDDGLTAGTEIYID